MTRLADHTTLRAGGEAKEFFIAKSEQELIALVMEADTAGIPLLILGGGSNILVADEGFNGRVIKVASRGIDEASDACSGGLITVQAGEDWDSFVSWAIDRGFVGLETLAGIPGTVGAAPIQNIGAYGHEVSEVIARVRTFDRREKKVKTLAVSDCGFGYRTSLFKREFDRYLILDVAFQMKQGELSLPIQYQELAVYLGVQLGDRAPIGAVREAVIALRQRKGMILDVSDRDTWSAGSFFTNPVIKKEKKESVPVGAASWALPSGDVKISAAWLIENAGISKGQELGGAAISSKHVLAITNKKSATAKDIHDLAARCKDAVKERFGIELESEVRLLGFV
jgi:UDP-N-acetylmuramate dehydrogenase